MEIHLRTTKRHLPYGVTDHPTQMNAPRLNPSQAGRYLIYLYTFFGFCSLFARTVYHSNVATLTEMEEDRRTAGTLHSTIIRGTRFPIGWPPVSYLS